jgi:ankyrin repeat protein
MEDYTDEEDEEEDRGTYGLKSLKLLEAIGINKIDDYITPIYFAIHNPNVEILRWFLDHAAVTDRLSDGSTLLNTIVQVQANPVFLDILKEYDYDIMEKIEDWSAFHYAAKSNGSIPVFEWLKNNGLDINLEDDDGTTPIWIAAMCNSDLEVLNWFTANGAVFDTKEEGLNINYYFEQSLIYNRNPDIFRWFLDHGADINDADADGDTILHVVAVNDCPTDNIIWMLKNDADPNICNNEGIPALDYLRERKDWKKIERSLK